ncbi:(-)-germacrene D synthase [Morus notabilis]|uniref:(-)-germacrene D synthase n=1 Tax=Morus notabilis TaxID=981085 RepID=W9R7V6_9ROSA|nr:(-)-germacrene D synthase [Morus notabilis]
MSITIPVLAQNTRPEIPRRTATHHPSIWGDRFLNYESRDMERNGRTKQQVEELKEVVRRELFKNIAKNSSEQLKLVDSVQRLGLSYHFKREMEEALQHIFETYQNKVSHDRDLYDVALRFRLLRQYGYNVSSDVFETFKDESTGKYKECLADDISSMLAFYEASHLGLHGEDTLEEALVFTTTLLKSLASAEKTDRPLSEQIICALKWPQLKSLERLQARQYISIYQDDASHNKALLELAKLDFNLLQSLYKKELGDITRWWKEVDFENKLPYIRDRIVELYVWALAVYFEPQYSLGRKILTKVLAFISVLDDTCDSYATFEELELFTAAIERWDIKFKNQLPEYMQLIFETLLNVYQEFEKEMGNEERYRVHYAKEAMKRLARAYFDEARWLNQGYIPSLEEYLDVAWLSSSIPTIAITSFVGMGDIVSKDIFEWAFNDPKSIRASAIIGRVMNDISSHKHGVSEQEAYEELNKQVIKAWKDINRELLKPTVVPMPVLVRALNLSRANDLFYKDGDGYTQVGKETKDSVAALLIDSIPLL